MDSNKEASGSLGSREDFRICFIHKSFLNLFFLVYFKKEKESAQKVKLSGCILNSRRLTVDQVSCLDSRAVVVEQEMGSLVERTMRASLRYLLAARSPRGLSDGE